MEKEFCYFDRTTICVGDYVLGAEGREGRVLEIFDPKSDEAMSYEAPNGGVLFEFDWSGVKSLLLMTPPDGEYWEDIEFVKRASIVP
jgi:hypothetical protein